jgi:hypothetical protein
MTEKKKGGGDDHAAPAAKAPNLLIKFGLPILLIYFTIMFAPALFFGAMCTGTGLLCGQFEAANARLNAGMGTGQGFNTAGNHPVFGGSLGRLPSQTNDGWKVWGYNMSPPGSYPCTKMVGGVEMHGHCWK